ncbi:coatomer subunit beta'-2-like protein, partial [Tanacetum coccineum]
MSAGMLDMAEDCLKHANDLSGLLLMYSSLGDVEEIAKLASLAKENGKNNVAFSCLFMLGKFEDCMQLLVERVHEIKDGYLEAFDNKKAELDELRRSRKEAKSSESTSSSSTIKNVTLEPDKQ